MLICNVMFSLSNSEKKARRWGKTRASLNPTKELPGIVPGSNSRPADIYIPHWPDGRRIAFDVSVTSPTQEAFLHRAAETAATAIGARKASKNRTHFEHCRPRPSPALLLNGWILDDGTIVGTKEELQRSLDIVATLGPAVGLHLNASKSRVWCGDEDAAIADPLYRGVSKRKQMATTSLERRSATFSSLAKSSLKEFSLVP